MQLKNEGKETNGSQLKYQYTQTQCEDGAKDVRVFKLTPVILFVTEIVIYKITADIESLIERKIGCESDTESESIVIKALRSKVKWGAFSRFFISS